MKPLDVLSEISPIAQLLREAPADPVRQELDRLDGLPLAPLAVAGRRFARGALCLREGRLDDACAALGEAAAELEGLGEAEAGALARCEAWLAAIRRGPRKIYAEAAGALERIEAAAPSRLVRVVAGHYRGVALRSAGQPEATLRVLLAALAQSEGLLAERGQLLNSLGTLYVVMGAYGAAQAVLEHAAELNHQVGDRVSEAISFGQLGSAALGRGELEAARRYLQRQEWLASRVGDAFGQARALTMLGDLAIDLGRPDDAALLAEQARQLAAAVHPPLGMWIGYATRTLGRAKSELGDPGALLELEAAREQFRKIGNQLGEALALWDMARHGGAGAMRDPAQGMDPWRRSAWALAGLGLSARVAQVLSDLRGLLDDQEQARAVGQAIAAAAQSFPHLSTAQEIELVYSEPDMLAELATRRIEGQRNLGRLAALTLAPPGLFVAVALGVRIGRDERAVPSARAAAALAGRLPGAAVWIWASEASSQEIARDLSSLRAACGDDTRAAVAWFPAGRVRAAPLAGELGALLGGVEIGPLLAAALGAGPAALLRDPAVAWDGEAEALARLSGYASATAEGLGGG
ncbi:MAG: tetratricopeptide repeat protein [Deltaproteobacteria bacterium]|nr:tetratricopeptide repeat protein [Deltaproteobacteria bacterium]